MPVRKLCELFIQQAKRYKEVNHTVQKKTKGKHTHRQRKNMRKK